MFNNSFGEMNREGSEMIFFLHSTREIYFATVVKITELLPLKDTSNPGS